MGESWIERTAIALLLMLLVTLGSRQWFRVEHAAASVVQRTETRVEQPHPQQAKGRGFYLPETGLARAIALEQLRRVTSPYSKS